MTERIRKISYKFYLTAQAAIAVIGISITAWLMVAGAHDIYISIQGKKCAAKVVGSIEVIESFEKQNFYWTHGIEKYADSIDYNSRVLLVNDLNSKCSSYLDAHSYRENGPIYLHTKNYIDGYPADLGERFLFIGASLGITLCSMGLLFGLMKWIRWLLAD